MRTRVTYYLPTSTRSAPKTFSLRKQRLPKLTELRRFKEEELPKMAVEVRTDDVEFQRLNCFVDSHQEAERVGKAKQAELVIWGKAYRNAVPGGNQLVNIQQTVNTGQLQATGAGSNSAGQVIVQSSTFNAVTPSATLLRPEANFHRTGNAIDFGNLAHLDLPTLSLSAPFQLVQFALGLHFYEKERYPIAARFFERSVKDILSLQDRNLGTLYQILGDAYLELPGGQQQSLKFSKTALEQFQGTGTSTEAYQRALAIDEKALGIDHQSVATDLHNIGIALNHQGKYAKALKYHQRALAIDEKMLGRDHPTTSTFRCKLALCLASISGWRENVSEGVIVTTSDPSSSAEAMGLQTGDWIVKYAGATVRDGAHFAELTQSSGTQANVALELTRNGKRQMIQAIGGKLGVQLANKAMQDWASGQQRR